MKAYTDLDQSRKLAEILPLESADFVWLIGHLHTDGPRYEVIRAKGEVSEPENYWSCWSLAALLDILPKYIGGSVLRIDMSENDFNLWFDDLSGIVDETLPDITKDNPIDACVEMIIKLHEQKLL